MTQKAKEDVSQRQVAMYRIQPHFSLPAWHLDAGGVFFLQLQGVARVLSGRSRFGSARVWTIDEPNLQSINLTLGCRG